MPAADPKSVVLRDTRWPTWSCCFFRQRIRTLAILFFAFLPWTIALFLHSAQYVSYVNFLDGTLLAFVPSWIAAAAECMREYLWLYWIFVFLPALFCQGAMLHRAVSHETKGAVFWWAGGVVAIFGVIATLWSALAPWELWLWL